MSEYSCTASLYDPIVGPALRSMHRAMVRHLTRTAVDSLVDLCCGTGLLVGMTNSAGIPSTGVDISRSMLAVARAKRPHGVFIREDATSLSFDDSTFAAATLSFALHEKPFGLGCAILTEAVRVVQPGGQILIADYATPPAGVSPWTHRIIRLIERIAGKDHHRYFKEYMARNGMEALFSETGLKGHHIETHLSGWGALYQIMC
ncbi:methyltransferase domain-containing protein [Pseudodesulfovibrio sp. JC047]|uniref:methyltransferase domain-containing protein n=1 Tax=Pseudodesulfovibrio sp. JC047 TaxID=2683199 RepID=UPI0013D1AF60|nr:methyltransferase domain-containing protein [Pseudodesulfovibrio sp. JC047]NDV20944.1 methyltransferase domain-containing protein [Pseudodesulfovibrio sp. JC047]